MSIAAARRDAPNGAAEGVATGNAGRPPPGRLAASRRTARGSGGAQLRLAQSFAQVLSVLMRDPAHRNLRIADLEWLVLPALAAGQFRLAHAPIAAGGETAGQGGALVPAAVALWARVSPEVDKALSENLDKGVRLSPHAWTSGDILWLMAVGGHPRAVPAFLKQLCQHEFKDKHVKMRLRQADGSRVVRNLGQASQPA
jgi:cytolysin-activating lysine-acyltransferase